MTVINHHITEIGELPKMVAILPANINLNNRLYTVCSGGGVALHIGRLVLMCGWIDPPFSQQLELWTCKNIPEIIEFLPLFTLKRSSFDSHFSKFLGSNYLVLTPVLVNFSSLCLVIVVPASHMNNFAPKCHPVIIEINLLTIFTRAIKYIYIFFNFNLFATSELIWRVTYSLRCKYPQKI